MVQTKKLVHSKSGWNHPLMMVPNLDKITAFMQTHGTTANNVMWNPDNADTVKDLYRMTGDFRYLNEYSVLATFSASTN